MVERIQTKSRCFDQKRYSNLGMFSKTGKRRLPSEGQSVLRRGLNRNAKIFIQSSLVQIDG